MSNLLLIAILIDMMIGCKEKIVFKEVISNKKVEITKINTSKEIDSIALLIPIEFQMDLNFPNIRFVNVNYRYNNGFLTTDPNDVIIKDTKTKRILFTFDQFNYKTYPKLITIINRKIFLSKNEAEKLIKKYNPKESGNNIKLKTDTIALISYSQFRKEQPEFLKEMRKQPDSLILSLKPLKGKSTIIREKINW